MSKRPENLDYFKKLVKERLAALPPNVSFSVGGFGDFSRDQLIDEIDNETDVGKAMIEMQINFIKEMPKILSKAKI